MRLLLNDSRASALRAIVRAVIVAATAFGLQWSAEQVAAVYGVTEAVLQAGRAWTTNKEGD